MSWSTISSPIMSTGRSRTIVPSESPAGQQASESTVLTGRTWEVERAATSRSTQPTRTLFTPAAMEDISPDTKKLDNTHSINPWPENPMGAGAGDLKYRFQWTYPIVISPHDPNTLYATANYVFRSTNEGMSWDIISPDLTRNDPSKLGSSGGPITKDNTSVEYYGTIFTFAESPVQKGILWSGSDDGVVQISRDGGTSWHNVTPKDLPDWSRISLVDASPHDEIG